MSQAPPFPTESARALSRPSSQQRQSHLSNDYVSPGKNMEALLRQWGASSSGSNFDGSVGLSNDYADVEVVGELHSIRMDRSASFDVESTASTSRANNHHLAPSEHRRIASTGNDVPSSTSMVDFASQLASPPQALLLSDQRGGGEESPSSQAIAPTALETDMDDGNMIILHGGMSALHDAARITDWRSVAEISESNPESAKYVGPDGWNALHHACDRRCPHVDVIDALLTAYPEAVVQMNDKGWTPLHRACRNKTPKDVVKLLLRKYPELGKRAASMRCNDGRSSLHYALLYDAPDGVVDLLLQADPGAVLDEDRDGVSPLGTVWDKYANSFEGKRMLHMLLRPFEGEGWELGGGRNSNNDHNNNVADERDDVASRRSEKEVAGVRVREAMEKSAPMFKTLQSNWKLTHTLLRAYFHFPFKETSKDDDNDTTVAGGPEASMTKRRKWRILHATSAIKCHPTMFTLARALHPEEALEVDENDLFGAGRVLYSMNDVQPYQEFSNRTALHFASMSPLSGREGRNVIKVLLKLNPLAASHADGHGFLPLHLICQNVRKLHWANFGAQDIYAAFPEATTCRDSFGRTPLHCIASVVGQFAHSSRASPPLHAHNVAGAPAGHAAFPPPADLAPAASDESLIQNLVESNSTAASMPDNSGRLPLHYIAEGAEDWTSDAQSILDAYPAAVQTRAGPSTHNQLPLHMATSSPDAQPSLIMKILNSNPRAASLVDGTGRLPLHLAVDSGRTSWDRGMDMIYSAYTLALTALEESPRRWTVLHAAAASRSAGRELIEKIIRLAAELASVPDGTGKYPLHLACSTNRSWTEGGIQAIFNADPSIALVEDADGLLPFHTAALESSASNKRLMKSEETILEVAATVDSSLDEIASLEVLFNLLIAQPSILHR